MKKYQIIYADPPWQYNAGDFLAQTSLVTSNDNYQYESMKFNDILSLPIASICDDNCLLFIWTTSAFLYGAIQCGNAWGFTFSSVGFVWNKERVNPGNHTMTSCEFVLIMKHGKIPQPRGARNIKQYLSALRSTHSTKPIEIRNRITKMFPTQQKIELFARQKTIGWDSWGNEVKNDIIL